jgi:hypothetical protein
MVKKKVVVAQQQRHRRVERRIKSIQDSELGHILIELNKQAGIGHVKNEEILFFDIMRTPP